jgi:hypothetical protein
MVSGYLLGPWGHQRNPLKHPKETGWAPVGASFWPIGHPAPEGHPKSNKKNPKKNLIVDTQSLSSFISGYFGPVGDPKTPQTR